MRSQTKSIKTKLFLLITLSLVALIATAISTAYYYSQQYTLSKRYYELKLLSQDINYYDEVLTMSTLAGVYSGDFNWSIRYNQHAFLLENTMMAAAQLDSEIANYIERTSTANDLLISHEEKAFALAKNGQRQQALQILNSEEYQKNKARFASGIGSAVDKVLRETKFALGRSQRRLDGYLIAGMVAELILFIGLWVYLIRYIRVTDKTMEDLIKADELSGLLNRREFELSLDNELSRAYRTNSIFTLAVFDLDNFKKYNDNYGHPEGDKVIVKTGRVLKNNCQRSNESAYRIGGEEFAIITNFDSKDKAVLHIGNIVSRVYELNIPHKYNEPHSRVTVSCGLAFATAENKTTPAQLYRYADEALYKAKESGRNTLIVFESQGSSGSPPHFRLAPA